MTTNNLDILKSIKLEKHNSVMLDIDDTLYDYKSTHQLTINLVYNKNISFLKKIGFESCEKFIDKYTKARSKVKKNHPNNGLTRSRYLAFLDLFQSIKTDLAIYQLAYDFEEAYWNCFIENLPDVDHRWIEFLDKCLSLKIKICVVTDMQTRYQVRKLQKLNLSKYIQFMVTSEDANIEKPDAKIFNLAIEYLKVKSDNIIMLGDNHAKDILGANNQGCQALRVGYHLD